MQRHGSQTSFHRRRHRPSNTILSDLPSVFDLSFAVIGQFVCLAMAGYLVARIISVPVPFLIGPLMLSMGFHLTGVINIPRINEFVFLAQLTIGGAVGARLGQVKVKVLAGPVSRTGWGLRGSADGERHEIGSRDRDDHARVSYSALVGVVIHRCQRKCQAH